MTATFTQTPPAPPRHLPGASPEREHLAHTPPAEVPIDEWVEQFNRDGYLFVQNVLPPEWCAELRADLDRGLGEKVDPESRLIFDLPQAQIRGRLFEFSRANLRLFDLEPIVTFAEKAVEPTCHVVHNNSFRTPAGGGISGWHQDDAPHYIVTHGEPPANVRLPCLLFTANYYLTDVDRVEHGPTQVVPGSHLFGSPVPNGGFGGEGPTNALRGTKYEDKIVSCLGPAGSVVIFNNQVWHRGARNTSDRTRYMAQVSYARRLVGHKYYPFMNYQMPEHVYKDAGPRLRRLLGFLPSGAYG